MCFSYFGNISKFFLQDPKDDSIQFENHFFMEILYVSIQIQGLIFRENLGGEASFFFLGKIVRKKFIEVAYVG